MVKIVRAETKWNALDRMERRTSKWSGSRQTTATYVDDISINSYFKSTHRLPLQLTTNKIFKSSVRGKKICARSIIPKYLLFFLAWRVVQFSAPFGCHSVCDFQLFELPICHRWCGSSSYIIIHWSNRHQPRTQSIVNTIGSGSGTPFTNRTARTLTHMLQSSENPSGQPNKSNPPTRNKSSAFQWNELRRQARPFGNRHQQWPRI